MESVDEVPIANEVTHVATKERRDDVLIMLEEAALLLRRHRAAEFGWCDKGILIVECTEMEASRQWSRALALLSSSPAFCWCVGGSGLRYVGMKSCVSVVFGAFCIVGLFGGLTHRGGSPLSVLATHVRNYIVHTAVHVPTGT